MKKVVIFGSTGMTGLCALEHALKKGLQVRVFVRDESKIPDHLRGKVEAVVGDVKNAEEVENAVAGQEGVVVVLGTRNDLSPTTVMSDGLKNIITAMKSNSMEVISVCLSAFLFYQPEKVPAIFKDINADHERMFKALKESGLKWIAVLPPHIADSPCGKVLIKYDESPGRVVSKHDLGKFLVDSLDQPEHHQKVCGITTTSA
ncbi:flavin reductase (NADPH) [Diachasma alloeum]|uniref:flavin reductase (NADPH) n=1 Tax=Diachasma alloeum TaxID=454923 RepID=UPI0007385097|nr:flavin reductase (NADPH) [Diachasma alloeum]